MCKYIFKVNKKDNRTSLWHFSIESPLLTLERVFAKWRTVYVNEKPLQCSKSCKKKLDSHKKR